MKIIKEIAMDEYQQIEDGKIKTELGLYYVHMTGSSIYEWKGDEWIWRHDLNCFVDWNGKLSVWEA